MRRRVKVVLLVFRPTPPELSAAVPLNGLDGPVPAEKFVPSTGEVTDAVAGAPVSIVMLKTADATEMFPNSSVAFAVMLRTPSLSGVLVVMPVV